MRALAREMFLSALGEATVKRAFQQHLEYTRGVLRVKDDLFDLTSFSRIFAVAMGKAARPMAHGLERLLGSGLTGILVEADRGDIASEPMVPGFRHFHGGHPVPTSGSLEAANAALQSLHYKMQNALVIFLISGGASAMMEKPLDDEVALEDIAQTYRALLHSGAPIAEMNAIRKHLSAVKGGRLAVAAHEGGAARQVSIMVSDVPDSTPGALASGPTMPDSTTVQDCYRIADRYHLGERLPEALRRQFARKLLAETPKSDEVAFHNCRWWTVLSNATLRDAVAAAAAQAGFAVEVDNSCDDWEYARAADHLLERLQALRQGVAQACLISGGEVTVEIPANVKAGIGGRNQQFALYCAQKIAGHNVTVLSAGSDGTDGNSPATGAVADGTTLQRAREAGCNVEQALANFDSFPLFERLSDAILTGATGTNVRDIRVLFAY